MGREPKNGEKTEISDTETEEKGHPASALDTKTEEAGEKTTKYNGIGDMLTALQENIRNRHKGESFNTSLGEGVLGLAPGRIVVLSGDSGVGKSSLGAGCIFDILYGYPASRAVICSVDLAESEILERELARLSTVPLQAIQERDFTGEQLKRVDGSWEQLYSVQDRLCILRSPLDYFHIEEAVRDFRADVLMLDYIQELDYKEGESRREGIEDMLRLCRRFKREGKTILITSEVTHTPSGPHPRESTQIRYEADDEYTMTVSTPKKEGYRTATLLHTKARRVPRNLKLKFWGPVHRWERMPETKGEAA